MRYKLAIFFSFLWVSVFSQSLSGVPTFNCIGLYGAGLTDGKIQYREAGSQNWLPALDLWKDTRAIGGRPANEWRGSVVNLKSGTSYEFQAGGATTVVTTWSETFPEAGTTTLNGSTNITTSGTPTGYRVYTGKISGGNNNLVINASYVIIRNMTLSGAAEDAIVCGANAHDVIIEGCDISGWGGQASVIAGNNQAAIRTKFTASTVRLIIQRNKIHDPRYSATGWSTETAGDHPYGVNAINLEGSGGNNVIRYNDIQGDGSGSHVKRFMDGIGGADNFTFTGAPGANSDIYGNKVQDCFDDGIEAEGGGMNVRIWGNFLNYTFTGIATATVSVGPMFVYNNVTNVGMRMSYVNSTEDRGPFNKCGSQDATYRGGRTYLFHNTILQPSGNRGLCGGIVDNGGQVTNVYSKNNIWTTAYQSKGGRDIGMWQGGSVNSENDLLNSTQGTVTKTGSITGNPTYLSTVGLEYNPTGYFLASVGKGKAIRIPNFNDQDGGDIGAYNFKNLEFGVNAYLGTTPPPVNQPPAASAGVDKPQITLPTNSVTLSGTGTDSDGTIILYAWSEVSGKTNYSLGSPNSPTTTASNLIEGKYTFRLTVTDNKGATGFADVNVTVNPAPPDPAKVFSIYQDVIIKYSDSTTKKVRIYH